MKQRDAYRTDLTPVSFLQRSAYVFSGGENISAIEVEQCVARHPAVLECAVVAIPDEKWGERPKAFVAVKPSAKATEAEIIEFCGQHIARFKFPPPWSSAICPQPRRAKSRSSSCAARSGRARPSGSTRPLA